MKESSNADQKEQRSLCRLNLAYGLLGLAAVELGKRSSLYTAHASTQTPSRRLSKGSLFATGNQLEHYSKGLGRGDVAEDCR